MRFKCFQKLTFSRGFQRSDRVLLALLAPGGNDAGSIPGFSGALRLWYGDHQVGDVWPQPDAGLVLRWFLIDLQNSTPQKRWKVNSSANLQHFGRFLGSLFQLVCPLHPVTIRTFVVAHNPDVQEIVGFVTRSGRSDEASQLQVQLWFPLWLGAATFGSSCSYRNFVGVVKLVVLFFFNHCQLQAGWSRYALDWNSNWPVQKTFDHTLKPKHSYLEGLGFGSSSTATFMGGHLVPEKTLPRTSRWANWLWIRIHFRPAAVWKLELWNKRWDLKIRSNLFSMTCYTLQCLQLYS